MKDYTAIGTMFTNNTTPEFVRGILLGMCRSLRAGNNNTCVVFAREIEDEIHPELQQRFQREDLQKTIENPLQYNPRQ